MTVANTIPAPNTADTDETREALRTRALRGLELHEARGSEIVRTGPFTYLVPSCSGGGTYAVDYAAETCDCPDFTMPRRGREVGEPCKHVYAVGIHRAKRRGTTVRKLKTCRECGGFGYFGWGAQAPRNCPVCPSCKGTGKVAS